MRARSIGGLWHDRRGAVAPTVALSLIGLIAAGGIAFDYARMASLDTELQNAADQAALAAAGQLDGKTGARTRGISAAQTLVANITYFANDGGGRAVTVPTITFFEDKAKTTVATSDAGANFVEVTVGTRS
ncbi:MAG TPA: pilus assembly protein TadG-related protein, partial [Allosphingosinicella sp.]